MRRFYCAELPEQLGVSFALSKDVSHHVLRVVGIAPKEAFQVFDGAKSMVVRIESVGNGIASCVGLEWVTSIQPATEIWLLLGILRSGPMSIALRMATELGVAHILPVLCERSVARGEKKQRWETILRSSAAQCGRVTLPVLHPVSDVKTALHQSRLIPKRHVLVHNAERRLLPCPQVAVWVGPEGGLSASEMALALDLGWVESSLGNSVLRADTAVAAALSQLG